jgi:hypothetical protein
MGNVRSGRDIDAALRKKGFRRDATGKHIQYYLVAAPGEPEPDVRTMMSHGMMGKTIRAGLIGTMARQLNITKTQFLALIDCTLDEEGLRGILDSELTNSQSGSSVLRRIYRVGNGKR